MLAVIIFSTSIWIIFISQLDFQCNNRTKRFIDSASNVPKYYSEYFGGEKKRYLELIFVADNSIVYFFKSDNNKRIFTVILV